MKLSRKILLAFFTASVLLPQTGFAANYDLKEITPAVQRALTGRQGRYADLQAAKQAGAVQENNQGLVSGAEPISSAENKDRMVIYRAIVEQNNLGAGGLEVVQRTFAETIRAREQR